MSASGEAGGGGASPEKVSRALTRRRVRFSRRPEKCAWSARGGFSGSDAFEEVGDLLQALLLVWSVSEKDVAGKFAGKGCRRGGDPTAMRLSGVVREENEGTGVKHGHWTVRRN